RSLTISDNLTDISSRSSAPLRIDVILDNEQLTAWRASSSSVSKCSLVASKWSLKASSSLCSSVDSRLTPHRSYLTKNWTRWFMEVQSVNDNDFHLFSASHMPSKCLATLCLVFLSCSTFAPNSHTTLWPLDEVETALTAERRCCPVLRTTMMPS